MYNKTPKCHLCITPLMSANQVVLDVYLQVQNQHIMGFSGPVDINFLSVKFIMDMMGIKNQKEVFERVHKLYRVMISNLYHAFERKKSR